jgi:hypothetical protein
MNEKRVAFRRRLLKNGLIVLSEKAPKIECTVRNASETGAALQLSSTLGIPQNFDVMIDGRRHRCRSQWRTNTKVGVLFEEV